MKTAGFLAANILDIVVTFMSLTLYLSEKITYNHRIGSGWGFDFGHSGEAQYLC
jgi:hypothetical protein